MIYRQGDVLLKSIESLPDGVKEVSDKTLAYGEVTGHSHRFQDHRFITRYEFDKKLYLQVLQPSTLYHEEHQQQIILPGTYEQIQEREYNYIDEEIATVVD